MAELLHFSCLCKMNYTHEVKVMVDNPPACTLPRKMDMELELAKEDKDELAEGHYHILSHGHHTRVHY